MYDLGSLAPIEDYPDCNEMREPGTMANTTCVLTISRSDGVLNITC